MLTVYGEGRGFRVVWLLEELGLPYRLRPVDLLAAENDRDFLAINPAGFIPALQDGETIMVESIAILEYLLARHGSGSLAVAPDDPAFASYLQFLHLGEAGLAGPMNAVFVGRELAPEAERVPGLPAGHSRPSRAGWDWLSAASRIAPISPATDSLLPISR